MTDFEPLETGRATYHNSEYSRGLHRRQSVEMDSTTRVTLSSTNSGRMTETKITAMAFADNAPPERTKDYKGRRRVWPGVLFVFCIVGVAAVLIVRSATKAHDKAEMRNAGYERGVADSRKIKDSVNQTKDTKEIVEDDGQVGNPKSYPSMGCELPNYQSKNGQIYAVAANGTEVAVGIKGVNWFGMETGNAIPFGLWENPNNGTTAYEIASFLARNKFNSVRLPLCIKSILNNRPPQKDMINLHSNRAINTTTYMTTIQTIVQTLAYRQITVMLSLHKLDPNAADGAWYSSELGVTENDFLDAVDILTTNLCSEKYWNILGLDLKNEPHECSWGGAAPDWHHGATLIGDRMLKGCPNWLAFVEGIKGEHEVTIGSVTKPYYDWWGGALEAAGAKPVTLSSENKVVYAPHYYNTGVSPAWYLYGGGLGQADGGLGNYVELDDATLKRNVEATFMTMFGYLSTKRQEAVVLGEFAGLYATDAHPKKTTKRTTDFTIQAALSAGLAGGYMWSLNPESAYQFNPADSRGTFTEGLLMGDWLTPNVEFLEGMAALDAVDNLKQFPCFPVEVSA